MFHFPPLGERLRKLILRMVVGNALLPDQEEYLEAGADFILTKPVREENVRKMLVIADERKKGRFPRDSIGSMPNTPTRCDATIA